MSASEPSCSEVAINERKYQQLDEEAQTNTASGKTEGEIEATLRKYGWKR
jgi:hypothetical protein